MTSTQDAEDWGFKYGMLVATAKRSDLREVAHGVAWSHAGLLSIVLQKTSTWGVHLGEREMSLQLECQRASMNTHGPHPMRISTIVDQATVTGCIEPHGLKRLGVPRYSWSVFTSSILRSMQPQAARNLCESQRSKNQISRQI